MINRTEEKPAEIRTVDEGMNKLTSTSRGVPTSKGVHFEANLSSSKRPTFLGVPLRDDRQYWESKNVTELLCKLMKEQSAIKLILNLSVETLWTLCISSQCLGNLSKGRLRIHRGG